MNLQTARSALTATAFSALLALTTAALVACGTGSDGSPASPQPNNPPQAAQKTAKNALPDGPAIVLGVEVSQPVADLGKVALNTPVRGEWLLRNTGATPVSVGRPSIEVLEGC